MDSVNIFIEIKRHLSKMPPRQATLARFILQNADEAKQISLQEICRVCETSEPVVFAFCKRLGVKSFTNLKVLIAESIGMYRADDSKKNKMPQMIIDKELHNAKSSSEVFGFISDLYIQSIEETSASLDYDNFNSAVGLLLKASRIVIIGVGVSGDLGYVVSYNFLRNGIPVSWTNDPHHFFTHIVQLGKDDVCIALSQTGNQKDTIEGVKFARKHGVKVISITSDSSSYLAEFSDVLLLTGPVPVQPFTHLSIGASIGLPILLVADALAVAFGAAGNREQFCERQERVVEAMKEKIVGAGNAVT